MIFLCRSLTIAQSIDVSDLISGDSEIKLNDKYWLGKYVSRFGADNIFLGVLEGCSTVNMFGYVFVFNNKRCLRFGFKDIQADANIDYVKEFITALKKKYKPNIIECGIPVGRHDYQNIVSELGKAGLKFSVRKRRYDRSLETLEQIDLPSNVSKRYVSEVGDDAVIEALTSAMRGKKEEDSFLNPAEYYSYLKRGICDKHAVDNWIIWNIDKKYVGVSFMQNHVPNSRDESNGSLCYFGVTSDRRESGVGTLLHHLSMLHLQNEGVKNYIGSTDVHNLPMIKLFQKNGCVGRSEFVIYRNLQT